LPPHKHRLQYREAPPPLEDGHHPWADWIAADRCGYLWHSSVATGGLFFYDERPKVPQRWQLAGAERFPPCPDIARFKTQLRAYFVLWGGRTGPNIPAARRLARSTVR
jgi:hypothetical protein